MSQKLAKITRKFLRKDPQIDQAAQARIRQLEAENTELKNRFNSLIDQLHALNEEVRKMRETEFANIGNVPANGGSNENTQCKSEGTAASERCERKIEDGSGTA